MEIGFFEEYPTEENLSKLKIISFPTSLYFACPNIDSFLKLKNKINKRYKNIKKIIYWPTPGSNEGYWISAFSQTKAIKRILKEIENTKEYFPVLWDAELPVLNKKLFFTEIFNVILNRRLIQHALRCQVGNHPLIVAEIPRCGIQKTVSEMVATSFPFTNYHRLDMLYGSKISQSTLRENKNKYQDYSVGLGLIAPGVDGKITSIISPEQLLANLQTIKSEEIKEAVIYRLGGLNSKYLEIIKQFID